VRNALTAADPVPTMPETVHAHLAARCAVLAAQCGAAHTVAGSTWTKLVAGSMASNAVKGVVFATLVGTAGTAGYYTFREPVSETSRLSSTQQRARANAPGNPLAPPTGSTRSHIEESAAELAVPATPSDAPRLSVPHKTKEVDTQVATEAATPQSTAINSVAAFDDPTIAEEAALLESARAVLVTNPAQALALAQQHQHLHPSGQLYAEREFIAVAALLRLGRRQEAWQRAEPRLKQAPDSLYSKRLRKLLAGDNQ
jgi:hypothetical protein